MKAIIAGLPIALSRMSLLEFILYKADKIILLIVTKPISNIYLLTLKKMNSNKDILDKAIGRPAMMAFMILVGTYVTTGQLIPGVF